MSLITGFFYFFDKVYYVRFSLKTDYGQLNNSIDQPAHTFLFLCAINFRTTEGYVLFWWFHFFQFCCRGILSMLNSNYLRYFPVFLDSLFFENKAQIEFKKHQGNAIKFVSNQRALYW